MLVNLKNRWLPSSDSPSYTAISPLSSEKHYDADVEAAATPEHFSVTHQFYDRPQSLASPDASLVRDERDTKEHYGRVTSQNRDTRIDPRIVSDAIIGLSDGLTVPFALTAGLSALGDIDIVVYGGLAELIAGAISMGLGGYLGAKSEKYVDPKSSKQERHVIDLFRQRVLRLPLSQDPRPGCHSQRSCSSFDHLRIVHSSHMVAKIV